MLRLGYYPSSLHIMTDEMNPAAPAPTPTPAPDANPAAPMPGSAPAPDAPAAPMA